LTGLVKLLLTAAGLRNETLRHALRDLLGKPFESANFVYISTASNAMPGDRRWLIRELTELLGLGWREFDVLDLNGLPRQMVIDRLLRADVIYGGGGDYFHLARSISVNGLAERFREALEGRVQPLLPSEALVRASPDLGSSSPDLERTSQNLDGASRDLGRPSLAVGNSFRGRRPLCRGPRPSFPRPEKSVGRPRRDFRRRPMKLARRRNPRSRSSEALPPASSELP
jgi:hypothetical protein